MPRKNISEKFTNDYDDNENPLFQELYEKGIREGYINIDNDNNDNYNNIPHKKTKKIKKKEKVVLDGFYNRATNGSAGYDLYNMTEKNIIIKPGETVVINTNVKITSCSKNLCLKIHSKSGLFFRRKLEAFPGLIDSDYINKNILVGLTNKGSENQTIEPNEMIAQFTVEKIYRTLHDEVRDKKTTEHLGFGSTGRFSTIHSNSN